MPNTLSSLSLHSAHSQVHSWLGAIALHDPDAFAFQFSLQNPSLFFIYFGSVVFRFLAVKFKKITVGGTNLGMPDNLFVQIWTRGLG